MSFNSGVFRQNFGIAVNPGQLVCFGILLLSFTIRLRAHKIEKKTKKNKKTEMKERNCVDIFILCCLFPQGQAQFQYFERSLFVPS